MSTSNVDVGRWINMDQSTHPSRSTRSARFEIGGIGDHIPLYNKDDDDLMMDDG